jgi:hypothetical protein
MEQEKSFNAEQKESSKAETEGLSLVNRTV